VTQKTVAHRATVHEEKEPARVRARPLRRGDEGLEANLALFGFHTDQRSRLVLGEKRGDPVERVRGGWPDRGRSVVATNLEVNAGKHQRGARHPIGDVSPFGGGPLQELAAGGYVGKEIGHLDAGAHRPSRHALSDDATRLRADLEGGVRLARPGQQSQSRDRCDRRERLAPETEAADLLKVRGTGDLAGGVALESQAGVAGRHPVAVVAHRDRRRSALPNLDPDPRGLRIDGVLDQLLDHRRRSFHHLARSDLVHQGVPQQPDPPSRRAAGSRRGRFSIARF
jgi:hypothetical protein